MYRVRLLYRFVVNKFPYAFSWLEILRMSYNQKKIKDLVASVSNENIGKITDDYRETINKFINYIFGIKDYSNVFFCIQQKGIGDCCYIFYLLRPIITYLFKCKNCTVTILSQNHLLEVCRLYSKYFPLLIIPYGSDSNNLEKGVLKIIDKNNGILIKIEDFLFTGVNQNLYIKSGGKKGSTYQYCEDIRNLFLDKVSMELNGGIFVRDRYLLPKINMERINYIIENFSNNGKLILCNFESRSMSLGGSDRLGFEQYLNKIIEIGEKTGLKFVINSVLNKEHERENKHFIVVRLSIEEIIWLAEYGKIKLFISERNGLNDLFYVFYKDVKQVIYYLDNLFGNLNKERFSSCLDEGLCLSQKGARIFPNSKNVREGDRFDYFNTVEKMINDMIDN